MENISKTAALSALLTKRPESVIGLLHKTVAVLSDDSCSLYNYVTGEKITEFKKFSGFTTEQYIAVDPDNTKLALYRANNLSPITPDLTYEIYDLATNKTMWNNSDNKPEYWQGSPTFNPHDNTIFIGNYIYGINSFNYKDNSSKEYLTPFPRGNRMSYQTQIRFNPTKQEMIFLADTRMELPLLEYNDDKLTIKQLISTGCDQAGDSILNAHYSPDGNLIAIIHQLRSSSLFDLKSNTNHFLDKEGFAAAATTFHPTEPLLAVLPITGECIQFYDTKTKELIISDKLDEPYDYNRFLGALRTEPISFSPEGDKLFITLATRDKIVIIDVPRHAK